MVHATRVIIVTIAVLSQRQAVVHGGRLHGNASFVSHTPWEKRRCRCYANNARRLLLTLAKRTEACEEGGPNIDTKSRRSWEESYALLCAFKEKYGHHDISQSEKPLGPWINRQRIEHAKYLMREEMIRSEVCDNLKTIDYRKLPRTSMTAHRKKLLDEFGFVWDAMGQTWDTRYEEL